MAARGKLRHHLLSPILNSKPTLYLALLFTLWLILFLFFPSSLSPTENHVANCDDDYPDIDPFYIYDLPPRFNLALLRRCRSLNVYTDMCPHVANRGLGRPLSAENWHATHQFLAEMIFHAAAERHPCRTKNPLSARLFYVPFYAGLYASSQFRQPNYTVRDALAVELLAHLASQPAWRRSLGGDHFLAVGRTAWDFMREEDAAAAAADFGANRLFVTPAAKNLTVLTVERHPWQGQERKQFGIPYPSYFHPKSWAEMEAWREGVRRTERTHLFAFVGGPRVGLEKAAMRAEILKQCGESKRCLRVECEPGSTGCHEPDQVMGVLRRAEFCMQPPGDSYTRRSVFDSVLAGCVPVFFSEHTAYTQYGWYLPDRPEEWSVFLGPGRWGRIEEELGRIPREEVDQMRARVMEMIPRVTYAHPNATRRDLGFRDAVDVALSGITRHVRSRTQTN